MAYDSTDIHRIQPYVNIGDRVRPTDQAHDRKSKKEHQSQAEEPHDVVDLHSEEAPEEPESPVVNDDSDGLDLSA